MDLVTTTSRFLATFVAIQLLASCSVYSPQYSDAQLSTLAKSIDERTIVDCLFPGEVRQLGTLVYVTPRISERATVRKCRKQGGEFALRSAGALLSRPQKHELREKALRIYRDDANDGNPQAQTYLAEIYEGGFGLPPDYDQAAFWYQKAADQKFARARNNLAFLYEKGLGVPKNIDKAVQLYAQAAGLESELARVDRSDSQINDLTAAIAREKRASVEMQRQLESVRQLNAARKQSQVDMKMYELLETGRDRQIETEEGLLEKIAKLNERVLSLESELGARVDRNDSQVSDLKATIKREKRASDEMRRQLDSARRRSRDAEMRAGQLIAELEQSQADMKMFESQEKEKEERLLEKLAKLNEHVLSLESDRTSIQLAAVEGDLDIDFGTYHALIIGNAGYQSLKVLKTAGNDARAVAAILERKYGFNITLLLDTTREQIIDTLSEFRRSLTDKDNLLIYYAGHGELATRGYWQPIDAKKDSPANWISNIEITDMLEQMNALHVLVVADSCYSGAIVRGDFYRNVATGDETIWRRKRAQLRSRTAITSGGLEPVIDSSGRSEHSVFASVFLRRLEMNDGIVEARSIFEAIAPEVTARAKSVVGGTGQTPEYGRLVAASDENGAFFFVPKTMRTWLNRNFFAAMFKIKGFVVDE